MTKKPHGDLHKHLCGDVSSPSSYIADARKFTICLSLTIFDVILDVLADARKITIRLIGSVCKRGLAHTSPVR